MDSIAKVITWYLVLVQRPSAAIDVLRGSGPEEFMWPPLAGGTGHTHTNMFIEK